MDTNPIVPGAAEEAALAVQIFEKFCAASTMGKILALFRDMCRVLKLKPTVMPEFYVKLKAKLAKSWRAQAIFRKLDVRSNFKIYNRGRTCANCRVLIIGGGPCGLRTAIDAQLLGAKVVVIEKRDRMTRNNILHLWPFVIQDLRNLAAKKFFGKFCAGSIDHISIRQLQFVLLKVALILGVEFHEGVSFEDILEPKDTGTEKSGWRASVLPLDHPVSNYEFDALIAADGKRNTLQGFKRKEFRGKLAIAITANFINKHTKEEAAVPEISGTAFIFKQKFFLDLNKQFYIDLENLVYYKGETHYFVMTAKKQSLLQRNVLIKDYSETTSLLSRENINYAALREYAQDAADYSTNFQLPKLEFAVNHYGQPDVAVFDFTSMFAAENASRILERHGHKLLVCLVGDGLLEPFWPTGSGCARGFLSSLDACWAIRSWGLGIHPLAILAERESTYRLLAQTTPQNLSPDFSHYTVDPATRYRNLNKTAVLPHQVTGFYDTDDPTAKQNIDSIELIPQTHTKKRKRDSQVHPDALLAWLRKQVNYFNLEIENFATPFKNGLTLCAVLHRYRPDLIELATLNPSNNSENLSKAFDIFEKEFGLASIANIDEIIERNDNSDKIAMIIYLSQIYHLFRGEIPFIRHTRTGSPESEKKKSIPRTFTTKEPTLNFTDAITKPATQLLPRTSDSENISSQRKSRKRRSSSKYHGQSIAERMRKLREKKYASEEHRRKDIAKFCLISRLEAKSLRMLESNDKPMQYTTPVDEDYNISSYRQNAPEFKCRVKDLEKLLYPEHDRPALPISKGMQIGEFSSRIKSMEDQIADGSSGVANKKPRDLMRAIGKIERDDWNFKQIEEKIQENQLGRAPAHGKEKVPKWNKEQFMARQMKIEHGIEKDPGDTKFLELDSSLKHLDRQLKEGNVLETGQRGKNKVASLLGQFTKKTNDDEVPLVKVQNNPKPITLNPGKLDVCGSCKKKVYLMEKITPEGNHVFHKSCFKCHYCSLTLKIGTYIYDREGKYGYKFFCTHHFGMGKTANIAPSQKVTPKEKKEHAAFVPKLSPIETATPIHTLNRGETPERIEIENQANDAILSEDICDEIDEDEWSDINFGNSFAMGNESSGNGDGDESSSSDEEFSEALDDGQDESDYERVSDDSQGSDVGSDGEFSSGSSSDRFSYHEYSSGEEEGASGTEGSEQRVARERRRQEVAIQAPPLTSSPTDTEVASGEESSSEASEAANSATEVSTDSEFAHDDPTPTRELPFIVFNDDYVCKTRGTYSKQAEENKKIPIHSKKKKALSSNKENKINEFAKVQVKTGIIINGNIEKKVEKQSGDIKLKFEKLLPVEPKAYTPVQRIGGEYLLSRTQSTSGIATKRALELKKKYLLGPQATIGLQKSDSASQLDTKFRTFHSHISECQKLLNPGADISPSMQAFLDNSSKRNGGLLSPTNVTPSTTSELISPKQIFPTFSFKFNANLNNSDSCETKVENPSEEIDDNTVLTIPSHTDSTISEKTILSNDDKTPVNEVVDLTKELMVINNAALRSQSPVLETSIVVPNIPWKNNENEENSGTDMESDSLISMDSSTDGGGSSKDGGHDSLAIPRVEIRKPSGEVMQLDSLMIVDGKYIGGNSSTEDENVEKPKFVWENKKAVDGNDVTQTKKENNLKSDGHISPNSDSGNDITAFFTDNEALDWAVDGSTIDIDCNTNSTQRKNGKHLSNDSSWELLNTDSEALAHVCGKGKDGKLEMSSSNILAYDHSDIDFVDTGSEESLIENITSSKNRELLVNRGFVEFVDTNSEILSNPVKPPIIEAVNRHCDSPVNDRSMDFIEQGACVLNNDTYLKDLTSSEFTVEKSFSTNSNIKYISPNSPKEENPNKCSNVLFDENKKIEEKDLCDIKSVKETISPILEIEKVEEISGKDLPLNKETSNIPMAKIEKKDKIIEDYFPSKKELYSLPTPLNDFKTVSNNNDTGLSLSVSSDATLPKKSCNSPKTLRKLEEISKEKVKQQDVIHQLVMDKMSKTTLNSEKRMSRRSRSSISPECFGKKSTPLNSGDPSKLDDKYAINFDANKKAELAKDNKAHSYVSGVKLTLLNDEKTEKKPMKVKCPNVVLNGKSKKYPNTSEAFSLPDLPKAIYHESDNIVSNMNNNELEKNSSNKLENRYKSKDTYHDISPLTHHAGIVPGFRQLSLDDCSGKLVQDVKSLRKSDNSNNDINTIQSKSSGNLYSGEYGQFGSDSGAKKGRNRDSERRKSIIKTVSDFFKRRDSAGQNEKKGRLQKDKFKSKDTCNFEEPTHVSNINSDDDTIPPPIPPLPTNIGQFSGDSDIHIDSSVEKHKNTCLLALERNERIKEIQYNLKVLEAKEHEKRIMFDEAKASAHKRQSYKNKEVMEQLLKLKRCVRKLNFQRQVENFLLEDLLLEDQYFDLRLKLMKPMQTKRESINKDMMDILLKRQHFAKNLSQVTGRYFSRDSEDELRREFGF